MAITFNTNLAALGAQRNIGIASNAASSSLSKLSSGSRIPQAKDDAAGLAIGSKLKSEVAGLTQASNNAAQAISLLQIADGALSTLGDILQRMKALAVQSSSGQLDDASRSLLNQEFTNLQSEVDRVANVTNFNGTTLLAGSTKVTSKTNELAAYSATNAGNTKNLIGDGFESIDFADSVNTGAIKIDYNTTGRVLTVKDLVNNKTQSITLDAGAIAAGDTETYNFGDLGVKITLNSNFDKTVAIAGANVASTSAAAGSFTVTPSVTTYGLTGGTSIATTISNISFNGTGANEIASGLLDGVTTALSGAVGTVALGNVTVGGHTFSTTTTNNLGAAGTYSWVLSDGQGNSFTVQSVVTGTYVGTASGNLALASTAGKIESTGTGANAPAVTKIVEAASPDAFDFGQLDNARVAINLTSASAATASITINGTAFTSAAVDLTSTGVKTFTLADADGNSFDVQFNVTKAFVNGGSAQIDLGQLGQIVSSTQVTSGSTTFNFKVGTGTTVNDKIGFSLTSATTTALGINGDSITTAANADTAIGHVNAAITSVASRRADVGAAQSRLDFASNSISVAIENTTAAQSALLDVDVSAEITNFTNENVLMQAGISLLSQANQQPALLLRLLQ
jgi:flagellin